MKGYMIRKTDYKYFAKTRQFVMISDYTKTYVGCVAVYYGHVISIGYNCNKIHPIQKQYNKYRNMHTFDKTDALPKLHAEINCLNFIRYLDINFDKIKLYIYRIRKDQPFGISRPCPSCMAAIKDLGIRNIYYTTNDGYVHERIEKYDIGGVA